MNSVNNGKHKKKPFRGKVNADPKCVIKPVKSSVRTLLEKKDDRSHVEDNPETANCQHEDSFQQILKHELI